MKTMKEINSNKRGAPNHNDKRQLHLFHQDHLRCPYIGQPVGLQRNDSKIT